MGIWLFLTRALSGRGVVSHRTRGAPATPDRRSRWLCGARRPQDDRSRRPLGGPGCAPRTPDGTTGRLLRQGGRPRAAGGSASPGLLQIRLKSPDWASTPEGSPRTTASLAGRRRRSMIAAWAQHGCSMGAAWVRRRVQAPRQAWGSGVQAAGGAHRTMLWLVLPRRAGVRDLRRRGQRDVISWLPLPQAQVFVIFLAHFHRLPPPATSCHGPAPPAPAGVQWLSCAVRTAWGPSSNLYT